MDDKVCDCRVCEDCELVIAMYYERERNDSSRIQAWVKKYRLCIPPHEPAKNPGEITRAPAQYESIYELTLTTTVDDPYDLRSTLASVVKSAMFDVTYYQACLELTKNAMPHIHAIIYSSRKYLDASKVKRFTKYRYELKRVRSEEAFINYIKKSLGDKDIQQYCERKGIPQIWDGKNDEETKV